MHFFSFHAQVSQLVASFERLCAATSVLYLRDLPPYTNYWPELSSPLLPPSFPPLLL